MNIGLFWDEAINLSSYYVKDGRGYNYFTNKIRDNEIKYLGLGLSKLI